MRKRGAAADALFHRSEPVGHNGGGILALRGQLQADTIAVEAMMDEVRIGLGQRTDGTNAEGVQRPCGLSSHKKQTFDRQRPHRFVKIGGIQ